MNFLKKIVIAATLIVLPIASYAHERQVEVYEKADWHGISFGTKTVIDAAPSTIWYFLSKNEDYPKWNPFTPQAKTTFEVGTPIEFKVRLFRALPNSLIDQKETVARFDVNQSMCWKSNIISDANFNTLRCINLSINELGQTVLENSMRYEGFSWPLLFAFSSVSVYDGFEDLSLALKDLAENSDEILGEVTPAY